MPDLPVQDFSLCCKTSLPSEAIEGIALFNHGRFFDCHELLEDAWRAETGPCRLLYQAILQLGVALHHVQQGNTPGARKVLLQKTQPIGNVSRSIANSPSSRLWPRKKPAR